MIDHYKILKHSTDSNNKIIVSIGGQVYNYEDSKRLRDELNELFKNEDNTVVVKKKNKKDEINKEIITCKNDDKSYFGDIWLF